MADNKFTLDLSGRRTRKIDEQLDQIRTEDRQNRANDARDEYIRAQLQEIALQDIYDRRQREYENYQKLQAAADNEYWSGRRFGLRPNEERNALVNPAPASRFDPGWLAAPSVQDAQDAAARQQDLAAETLAARGGGTLLSNEELERQAAQYTANANRANAAAENLQRQRIDLGRVAGQARTYGYEKNRNAPDFADLSRYQTTATGEGREVRDLDYNTGKTTGGTHREYEYGDLAYDFINQNRDAAAQWSYNAVRNNAGLLGMDNRELRQMTPDEIAMFNYLYAKDTEAGDQTHKNAYDYIRFIQSDPLYASGDGTLNARQRAEETEQAAAFAQAHPVAASAGTVLANPLKAITYLSQAADFIDDGKMETDAGYNRYSYIPTAIRDTVSKEVEQKWSAKGKFAGKAATFAYQTGMSMADFLFNTAITGGFAGGGVASEALALSLMGTEAAADATLAAKDRGLDDAQAFAIGTIAGAAEIITEKFSIEALLNNVGRAGLSYWLKNAFTEGAEEIGSDFINLMADILIAKDKGEWQAAIDAYVAKGYTKEEAFGKALGDQAAQMGVSFLGGALSGGVMGGVGAVRIGFLNSAQGADYRAEAQQNGTEMDALRALAEAGLQSGDAETARLAQNMQDWRDAGKRIPDRAVGRLAYELDETLGDTEDEEPAAGPSFRQEMNRPRSIEEYAARQTGRPYTRYANENFEEAFRTAAAPAAETAEARPTLRSLNTDQIDRAAASFGKEGGAALRANYNSGVSPSEYFRDFSRFYNAGITGRSTETMDMGVLTPEQRVAAYEAGAKDQTATAKATASANVGFHDSTGLVGRFTSAVLDKLAKLTRTSIEIDPNVDDLVNGQIIGNRIILQKASDFELIKTAKHEITHRLQELAPEAYKTYRDFALNTLADNGDVDALVRRYQQDYKRVGQNLSPAQAMDEIAADFTEALVTEAEKGSTETFEKLAAHDAKAASGFVRAIRDFIARVKRAFSGRQADEVSRNTFGVGLDKLEQAAKLWDDLLQKGEKAAQELGVEANENAASEETAGKFSTKAEVLALQGVDWVGNKTSIKEQLRLHADELNAMDPVAVVEYIHKPKESIIDLMMGVLPYLGGGAIKNSGVSFNFDLEGAKSINGHATGAELRAAALSAPYVAKRGRLIAGQKNHENTGLTTLTFGAPVIINNVRVNVGVVVQFESNGRPRAVNVGLQSGKRFRIEELKAPRGTSSRVTRYSGQGTSLDTRDAFNKRVTQPGEEVKKYSLKSVQAVRSTSGEWAPGLTEADVRAEYPNLYGTPYDFVQNLQEAQRANENAGWADDASRGHPTQRANTIASYKKMLSMVGDKSASILDASSGLGMGTQYGRQQGYDVDDIEPYAGEGYTPRYTDYSKLRKKYDYVFSNAVLNVLPQDQRDSMVWHIANALKPGGKALIAVRNAAAIRAIKSGVVLGNDTAEVVVPGTGASSYQKGFTPDELQAYLQDAVGDGYTVEKVTGKDRFGDVCAVITKTGGAPVQSVSGVAYDTPAPAYDGSDTAVIEADDGSRYSLKSAREDLNDFNWDTFSKGKMYKDMSTIMSDKDIHALFDGIIDLVEYMTPNRDILDMNEATNKGDRKFKPYKPNSDPLYKISLDFSTLCRKRLMTQFVISQLQLRENRALTAEEQLTVRNMLIDYRAQDKALQVACAMCYVEAARLKSPKFINAYLENPEPVIIDYLAKKSKRFAAEIKNRQADYKEAHGYARSATKDSMSSAHFNELNRLSKQWRQEYKPNAEEQRVVDLAKKLPNSTYLTPENLANLAAGSPEEQVIHAAYTNYIRESTHSKALETGVAYYYGDSKKVSAKRLAGFNAENGLRFDSWSDFQFEHMLDMMMAVIDLSTRKVGNTRGAKMHGYTKFPEMVRIFGKTGMMFNLSGVSEGDGFNEDGSLRFSKSESIDYDEAIAVRDAFPETAGLQCIGINDRHILSLMASDMIDYIIPYHRSGLSAALRRLAGIDGWTDYEGTQEASIDKSIQFDPEKHDAKTWHKEPVFSEFFVGYGTGMSGIEAMRASAERYKQMCAERGMKPKFEKFSDNENYWKLLIDRKMINQKTGALIEQKAVRPVFDFDAIKAEIDKYVANYDPELQNRALEYITENWQAEPVEQASVLGNEMLAAQQDGVEGVRNSLRNNPLETMQQAEAAQRALERENNDLRERVAYWKGQTRRSTGVKTNPAEVKRAARRIARYYSSDADIAAELQELYDWIANGGQDVSGEEANRRARAIADKVVDSALETEAAQYDMYGDLRDYLRRTELSISQEDRANIQDYNDWRKQYFGRMNLKGGSTNIDSVYMEMSELWPELFPDSITHPADQLLQIAEVADQIYTVTEHNPFAGYEDEAAVGIANEILETFFDLPQVKPTFADYQARKLAAEKAKGAEKLRALRAQKNEQIERITRTERDKRTEQADRLRRQRDEAIAKLREQNRETVRRALARSMETRERQLSALKERYAKSQAKSRDARSAREIRGKILRHSRALSEKLMRPTDKAHIPEVLQKPVAELLAAINQESLYTIDRNGKRVRNDSGDPTKRTQAFRALKERYEQILKQPGEFEGVIDPDLMDNLTDVIAMKDVKLAEMSLSQLDTVWKTLKGVEASVNTWNKTFAAARFATVSEAAEAIREENADKQERTQLRGFLGSAQTLTGVDMMTPEAYFHRLGKPGDALFREMRNAQDKQITILKAVSDYTTDALKGTDARKLEQEMHTVTLGGESVQMSTAQLMELYVLMRREQARQHILVGGILPEAVNTKGLKKVSRAEPVRGITVEEIADATSKLTEKQRAVAEALQSYASTELSRYGNEASMQVYGYKKFGEEFYWPIRSNKQEVKTDIGKDIQAPTVSNKGMTKLTVPNANNSVMIGSIFDTFTQHSTEMATYAAWLAASEDVNRVRNFTFWDDVDGARVRTGSVKGILDRVYGSGGSRYLGKLLEDIANGVNNGDAGFFDRLTGSYKASAVGANLRVIIQQPTAILRALDMIDLKYMTSGLAANPLRGWRKATEYAPIAQWKDWGYFDVSTGRSMKDVMFQATSRLEKARNVLMAPAGWADSVSWGYLWNAVEREIRATTDLTGAEFDRAVAARFTEIVDRTQVVDGILQRSQIMRKGGINKMATAFMAEPTKQYNMLLTSAYDVRHSSGATKRAAKIRLARTAVALLASGVVNAAAQAIIDALRDSDREKDYWEKWMDAFVGEADEQEKFGQKLQQIFLEGNLGSQFMPLNYIPYIKDAVSLIQGYDVGRMDMESIASFIKAAGNMIKALNGEGKLTTAGALANIVGEASRLLGIPAANARRDAESLAAAFIYSSGNYVAEYRYEKWSKRQSTNKNTFYDILYNAYKDDFEAFNIIYNDMLAGGEFVSSDKSAADAIASAMESRMKEEAGVSSVKDLANRFTPDVQVEIAAVPNAESAVPDEAQQKAAEAEKEQAKEATREADRKAAEARANAAIDNNIVLTPTRIAYNEHVEKIQDSALWPVSGLDDREEILELIDEMTSGSGDRGKGALKTVAAGAEVGMTEDLYLLYDLAWHMADKANDGNGSLKQSEFIEAMKNVDMTPEQRTFLWNRKWKPGKMPDWTKPKNQW